MLTPDFWKKYFTVYDTLNRAPAYTDFIDDVLKVVDPKPGEKILDAGIGTGNLAVKMAERGAIVTGIDFSPVALAIAKKKIPSLETHEVDLTKGLGKFEDNYFDVIVSSNVLYNIPRNQRDFVVKEFKRKLKPGGRIVLANVLRDFSPIKIFFSSFKTAISRWGLVRAIFFVIESIPATTRIFMYNNKIKRNYSSEKNIFSPNEQNKLMLKYFVIKYHLVSYAGQAEIDAGVIET